jgi:hypothetical protein
LKSTLGALEITTQPTEKLEVLPHRQVSPDLENCCYLVKNLHKVGGSIKWLHQAERLLCQGQVEAAMALFSSCQRK